MLNVELDFSLLSKFKLFSDEDMLLALGPFLKEARAETKR